jgi:hypothetical protein
MLFGALTMAIDPEFIRNRHRPEKTVGVRKTMSIAKRPKDMRRFQREEVCFRIEIAGPAQAPANALIVNISPLGCLLRCSQPTQPDAELHFTLPTAGRIQARVIWAIGGRIGLEFSEEIDATPYLAMLDQLNRPGDEMGSY